MKKLVALSAAMLFAFAAFADVLIVEGKYQNKNLYVINGVNKAGVGFCTYEVRVNGELTTDELNSSAFEVDLTLHNLQKGDAVTIELKYREGCPPKILNPDVLTPKPTFEVLEISLEDSGVMKWKSHNETADAPYEVQQFMWSKWVKVGEVKSEGKQGTHSYAFKIEPVSGENKVRVIKRGPDGKVRPSKAAKAMSSKAPVTFEYIKKSQQVTFSEATGFEVYDKYGRLIKKGHGDFIDVSNLEKGTYHFSYDNSVNTFDKK